MNYILCANMFMVLFLFLFPSSFFFFFFFLFYGRDSANSPRFINSTAFIQDAAAYTCMQVHTVLHTASFIYFKTSTRPGRERERRFGADHLLFSLKKKGYSRGFAIFLCFCIYVKAAAYRTTNEMAHLKGKREKETSSL